VNHDDLKKEISRLILSNTWATMDEKVGGSFEAAEAIIALFAKADWQNLDRIIDVLEKAGCCRDGYVNAPEDVVANTLRDWLRILALPE
jgi:hypothetical protein